MNSFSVMTDLRRTMSARTPAEGYIGCCKSIRDHAGFDHSNTKIPTLCITGSADGSTSTGVAQVMAGNMPSAEYFEFKGVGHLPGIEYPQRFAEIIVEFAKGLS